MKAGYQDFHTPRFHKTKGYADQSIQYEFEAKPGDGFVVKLILGEAEITEDFVV